MLENQIRLHDNFYSHRLSNSRRISVFLPDGYEFDPRSRFPVFYLHDGQNLFDAGTAFGGAAWRADEIAQQLIWRREIKPLIIVGVENTGLNRINEYTPVRNWRGQGGAADFYGKFLIEELKPFVDYHYRTLPGREFTVIGGSSLGGLVSLYLGLRRPDVFSRVAAISPSVWWGNGAIFREVGALNWKPPVRIWLDIGGREGINIKRQTRYLRDALVGKDWKLKKDLFYLEARGGRHDEISWSARFDRVLKFLFRHNK